MYITPTISTRDMSLKNFKFRARINHENKWYFIPFNANISYTPTEFSKNLIIEHYDLIDWNDEVTCMIIVEKFGKEFSKKYKFLAICQN